MTHMAKTIENAIKSWANDPKGLAPDLLGILARTLARPDDDIEGLRAWIAEGVNDHSLKSGMTMGETITRALHRHGFRL